MINAGSIDIVEVLTVDGVSLFLAPYSQLEECIEYAKWKLSDDGVRINVKTKSVPKAAYPHLSGNSRVEIPGVKANVR